MPFAEREELVRNSGLASSALIEVRSDHRLADPEPLERLLGECESVNARKGSMILPPTSFGHLADFRNG